MTRTQLSAEGLQALQKKLLALIRERTQLATTLNEARQLKDADEFDLVNELTQLALVEKQIRDTRYLLTRSQVDTPTHNGIVQRGSTVDLETPQGVLRCKVVDPIEADPGAGRISDASPLGAALLGKAAKMVVHVQGPRRGFTYRVLGVSA